VAALVRDRFGGVDLYVAHAGVKLLPSPDAGPPDAYDAEFAANTRGVAFGVQQILPLVRDGGSIILAGSIAR
jgi:NAD(P)-dependent dehydrogenase (short-subunit alcohol dehydrogenase family)